MDARNQQSSGFSLSILGAGWVAPEGLGLSGVGTDLETQCDPSPFLKDRKAVKFMAKQDKLALVAARRALEDAGLTSTMAEQGERVGIYLAVGPLPFEADQLEILADKSEKDGLFDLESFSLQAYPAMNPLLTFKCLPNMPVFHISFHLGARGRYFVTYPGIGQWGTALRTAASDLSAGRVDRALVGVVCDQRNVLVDHHYKRSFPSESRPRVDAGAMLVLGRPDDVLSRGVLSLEELKYHPVDPFEPARLPALLSVCAGPAEPALEMVLQFGSMGGAPLAREIRSPDGVELKYRLEPKK